MYPQGHEFIPERWLDSSYPTYQEPLSEFPNLRGDKAFGYGNRSCPGVDLTSNELHTLIGSLLWAFDIKRPEGKSAPIPWYETAPWVITMSKPFKCDVKIRSEKKAAWIREAAPDGGNLIKDHVEDCKTRWDVARKPGEELFAWDGLTEQADHAYKTYGPGV